jgi:suppressor of G2 allele of SKP1
VIISFFCKNVVKEKTTVTFKDQQLDIHITFKDGQCYDYNAKLYMPVKVDSCKYEVLSTKIEVTLAKIDALNWPQIEA